MCSLFQNLFTWFYFKDIWNGYAQSISSYLAFYNFLHNEILFDIYEVDIFEFNLCPILLIYKIIAILYKNAKGVKALQEIDLDF